MRLLLLPLCDELFDDAAAGGVGRGLDFGVAFCRCRRFIFDIGEDRSFFAHLLHHDGEDIDRRLGVLFDDLASPKFAGADAEQREPPRARSVDEKLVAIGPRRGGVEFVSWAAAVEEGKALQSKSLGDRDEDRMAFVYRPGSIELV